MLFLPCSLKTGKKLISWEIRSLKVLEEVGAFLRAHAFGRFEIELKSFPGLQPVLLPIAKSWKVLLMPMPCEAQPHTSNNSFCQPYPEQGVGTAAWLLGMVLGIQREAGKCCIRMWRVNRKLVFPHRKG